MGAAMGGMSLQDQLALKLQQRNNKNNLQSTNNTTTDSSKWLFLFCFYGFWFFTFKLAL